MARFDHVVVGAGIVGSCAALELVKTGKKVLLVEQFNLPHTRGSSHGPSRLIRSCYSDDFFARLMPRAFQMWRDLEEVSGSKLLELTGVLCIAEKPHGSEAFARCRSNMATYSSEYLEDLDSDQFEKGFPMLRFGSQYEAFIDKSGGAIYANKALSAVQTTFKNKGGELWDGCHVDGILPGSDVTVVTSRGDVTCEKVVVCAGAWTDKLLKQHLNLTLPLQAAAVKVYYWRELEPGTYSTKGGFMSFIDISSHPSSVYGFPSLEYPGLAKVTIHGGSPCDPDAPEKANYRNDLEDFLVQYIKDHIPGLETEPAIIEKCMYTLTPDEVFIVDVLPDHPNVVIGTGFSGTGFKTAPIIGKILSELAIGEKPSLDITNFSLSRFSKK